MAKEIGAAGYFVVDIGNIPSLPAFVEKVIKEAPEIDFLLNNLSIRRLINFEAGADLNTVSLEISINTTGLVLICGLFIPHLKTKQRASIQNVPVYRTTKSFTLSLCEQLCCTNITVVEISPPRIDSEPRGGHINPDNTKKENHPPTTSQKKWIAHLEKGWDEGNDEIGDGWWHMAINTWRKAFGAIHRKIAGQSYWENVDLS
ncbi:hypothetical protein B0J17DRAFT_724006 [Rhizoctonia solani]|nr:hypothetical protein B0J17DRAFT_724006 [Rhizoctonia solani]